MGTLSADKTCVLLFVVVAAVVLMELRNKRQDSVCPTADCRKNTPAEGKGSSKPSGVVSRVVSMLTKSSAHIRKPSSVASARLAESGEPVQDGVSDSSEEGGVLDPSGENGTDTVLPPVLKKRLVSARRPQTEHSFNGGRTRGTGSPIIRTHSGNKEDAQFQDSDASDCKTLSAPSPSFASLSSAPENNADPDSRPYANSGSASSSLW